MNKTSPKRLVPPQPTWQDGGTAMNLAGWLEEIEDGLLRCGARPGVDYMFRDLITLVCNVGAFDKCGAATRAIQDVASALQALGTGGTQPGAIEFVGMKLEEAGSRLTSAIESITGALEDANR